MVPDSACSATALFSGIKANLGTLGVDATVPENNCEMSLNKEAWVDSLAAYALKAGKSSGKYLLISKYLLIANQRC